LLIHPNQTFETFLLENNPTITLTEYHFLKEILTPTSIQIEILDLLTGRRTLSQQLPLLPTQPTMPAHHGRTAAKRKTPAWCNKPFDSKGRITSIQLAVHFLNEPIIETLKVCPKHLRLLQSSHPRLIINSGLKHIYMFDFNSDTLILSMTSNTLSTTHVTSEPNNTRLNYVQVKTLTPRAKQHLDEYDINHRYFNTNKCQLSDDTSSLPRPLDFEPLDHLAQLSPLTAYVLHFTIPLKSEPSTTVFDGTQNLTVAYALTYVSNQFRAPKPWPSPNLYYSLERIPDSFYTAPPTQASPYKLDPLTTPPDRPRTEDQLPDSSLTEHGDPFPLMTELLDNLPNCSKPSTPSSTLALPSATDSITSIEVIDPRELLSPQSGKTDRTQDLDSLNLTALPPEYTRFQSRNPYRLMSSSDPEPAP